MILPIDTQGIADLDRVGAIIDHSGIAAVPHHLLQSLADEAAELGVRPVAAAVLTDTKDPLVARERAFAKLAVGLIGATTRPPNRLGALR